MCSLGKDGAVRVDPPNPQVKKVYKTFGVRPPDQFPLKNFIAERLSRSSADSVFVVGLFNTVFYCRNLFQFRFNTSCVDNHTPEQRKKNMQAIKSKDTSIEVALRKELWNRGLRYQKNSNKVPGHPDLVFIGKKVAVFCDSEFWHGYDWEHRRDSIKSNRDYWIPKIEYNLSSTERCARVSARAHA